MVKLKNIPENYILKNIDKIKNLNYSLFKFDCLFAILSVFGIKMIKRNKLYKNWQFYNKQETKEIYKHFLYKNYLTKNIIILPKRKDKMDKYDILFYKFNSKFMHNHLALYMDNDTIFHLTQKFKEKIIKMNKQFAKINVKHIAKAYRIK